MLYMRIIIEKGYSNLVVNQVLSKHNLDNQDRSLITRIIYGTLQKYYLLDWELSKHIKSNTNIRLKFYY